MNAPFKIVRDAPVGKKTRRGPKLRYGFERLHVGDAIQIERDGERDSVGHEKVRNRLTSAARRYEKRNKGIILEIEELSPSKLQCRRVR